MPKPEEVITEGFEGELVSVAMKGRKTSQQLHNPQAPLRSIQQTGRDNNIAEYDFVSAVQDIASKIDVS